VYAYVCVRYVYVYVCMCEGMYMCVWVCMCTYMYAYVPIERCRCERWYNVLQKCSQYHAHINSYNITGISGNNILRIPNVVLHCSYTSLLRVFVFFSHTSGVTDDIIKAGIRDINNRTTYSNRC